MARSNDAAAAGSDHYGGNRLVLMPIRKGRRLIPPRESCHRGFDPYVQLFRGRSDDSKPSPYYDSFVLGRQDFLTSRHAACGCRSEQQIDCGEQTAGKAPLCCQCQQVRDWARRYLSRRMIQLTPVEAKAGAVLRVRVRGINATELVWVDGRRVVGVDAAACAGSADKKLVAADEEGWMGNARLSVGSVLALGFPGSAEAALCFEMVDLDRESEASANEHVRNRPASAEETYLSREQVAEPVAPVLSPESAIQQSFSPEKMKPNQTKHVKEKNQKMAEHSILGNETKLQQIRAFNDENKSSRGKHSEAEKSSTATSPPKAALYVLDPCSPARKEKAKSSGSGGPIVDSEVEVIEICESGDDDMKIKSPCLTLSVNKKATSNLSTMAPTTGSHNRMSASVHEHSKDPPRVLLLQLGQSMSSSRVRILRSMLEKREDLTVVDSLAREKGRGEDLAMACTPTHVVIDEVATAAQAASALGLQNAEEMANVFAERTIKAVKPEWVMSGSFPSEPTLEQCWTGLRGVKMKTSRKRRICQERTGPKNSSGWIKKQRRADEFAKVSVIKASSLCRDDDNGFVSRIMKRRREDGTCEAKISPSDIVKSPAQRIRNKGMADMFDQLSKLHKLCPILENDEWRTYHYAVIAGRLRSLDFDVVNRRDVLDKLSSIKGFGQSAMTKVQEYLKMGTCHKLIELRKDPMRAGVSRLIKIHGVGAKKAAELVRQGYTNISQVRHGLSTGALDLSGVSLIGCACYEEFSEKMDRAEAELIAKIVLETCNEIYPGVEADIMGSYRREKESLGDVDILLTHPDYINTTPRGALGDLVNRLRRRGHIAFDLNHVEGLIKPSELPREGSDSSTPLVRPPLEMATLRSSQEMTKAVSYMGVFFSPVIQGKRRRVDIKFYPYREKAFATLYFTGSGWFNRSMRLWATRKKQMSLNDHGLFPINMSGGAMKATGTGKEYRGDRIGASSEKEIFEMLDLVYRQPHERDCFDAVVEKGSLKPIDLGGDFAKDPSVLKAEASHTWID